MRKKIALGLGVIVFMGAAVAGATGAFFSDTETSTGNTFTAGAIDLKIDNESYTTDNSGALVASPNNSWASSNLTNQLFFSFSDLKPGDRGEDTISLVVDNNDAYACMDVTLTQTPENGQNEPEALSDSTAGTNAGELQNELYFAWWADDGDNVYEQGENIFKQGKAADIFTETGRWALSDSQNNVWGNSPAPIPGESTRYIAKYWCYGTLAAAAVTQDQLGKTGNNGPLVRGTGFTCNGQPVTNASQTDGISVDVAFEAIQSRNNAGFKCNSES